MLVSVRLDRWLVSTCDREVGAPEDAKPLKATPLPRRALLKCRRRMGNRVIYPR